ncbi:MAG TPA: hypothetical protein VIL24_03655 [Clostridia bacterium]
MKKARCCLTSLILIVALLVGIFAAGYFGGNFLLKKYFGAEGEILKLNINNWEDLFKFLSNAKNLISGKPEISDADKPSEQNLNQAKDGLQNSIIGYDQQTGIFDMNNIVFKAPLKLTGGQLAALIDEQITSQQNQAMFSVGQVKLDVDPDTETSCVITFTIIIKKESIVQPLKQQLGVLGSIIADSMSDVYLTSVNKVVLDFETGKAIIDENYAEKDLYLGEKNESSSANDQVLNVLVMLFGAQDKDALNAQVSNVFVEAINKIGKASFDYDNGVSYLVFENANNNELIYELVEIAELNVDNFNDLAEDDKQKLASVKTDVNDLLGRLASTALSDETAPTKADVESAVYSVKAEYETFVQAFEAEPASADLTGLQNAVEALKALFNS